MSLDKHVQNILLFRGEFSAERDYWLAKLQNYPGKSSFPYDHHRLDEAKGLRALQFTFPEELAQKLFNMSNNSLPALLMLLATGLDFLLYKYTGNTELVTGMPVFKQAQAGAFINTLLTLRLDLKNCASFKDLLLEVKNVLLGANKHQNFPAEKLIELLNLSSVDGKYPLFNTAILLENIQEKKYLEGVQVDLVFSFRQNAGTLRLQVDYDAKLYAESTIEQICRHLTNFYSAITDNPGVALRDINILAREELQEIVSGFNNTSRDYPRDKTIHQLFEEVVAKMPEHLAVISAEEKLTYAELNRQANQLAGLLQARGVQRGTYVAVLLNRSVEMVIGVLGIVKAGGIYVPFQPDFPEVRIQGILANLNVKYLITEASLTTMIYHLQWKCPELQEVIYLDVETAGLPPESVDLEVVQSLWNHVAENARDRVTAGGFISSYTGQPFSEAEVDEYRDYILQLLQPYLHQEARVLDIGCGSGLIMFAAAPKVSHYVGLDPSKMTQRANARTIAEEKRQNIELITGFAHEINTFQENSYDVIILASTIQFFPGYIYLQEVIKAALYLLKPTGVILLADIPDMRQKEEFKKSLPGKADIEKVLYVDERFFTELIHECSELAQVQVLKRKTGFQNELRYRFDVVLAKEGLAKRTEGMAGKSHFWTRWHLAKYASANPISGVTSDDIAYIIYTSGSTGVPKGVVVKHRPVVNVLDWVNRTFGVGPADRLLFITSLCFDLSVYDIFGILAAGGTIRVASNADIRNPERLLAIIEKEGITFWDSAPAALQQLVPFFATALKKEKEKKLRLVFLSGDWIPVTLPDTLKNTFQGVQVVSLGGATEGTIWSNYYPIGAVDPAWPSIPYGKPIQNARYYILNDALQPCPIGVPGDLYIGGECLASGYINDLSLTAEKFIPDPFSQTPTAQLYKTGDQARWFADGNMEFLGRKDHQVKIRGYRIETGEIESQLLKHPAVNEAIVIARTDESGAKYLCAYLVLDCELTVTELKEYLSSYLPDYMIPSFFVRLPELPVTANGKVDRKALPAPASYIHTGLDFASPETQEEAKLTLLWQEVLGVEKVGVNENFFELGGHSLKATTLITRIRKEFGVEILLRDIFSAPTIKTLAGFLQRAKVSIYSAIEPVEARDYYPVSSAQKRLLILSQFESIGTGYNMPGAIFIEGDLDYARLEQAFQEMVRRHETLRTSFHYVDGEPVQYIHPEILFQVIFSAAEERELPRLIQEFVRPFDLGVAPLFRASLVKLAEFKHLLMFDLPHVIADGASITLLVREFCSLYQGKKLPELRIQYKDFAVWQNQFFTSTASKKEEEYWLARFAGNLPVLNLPLDYPRPETQTFTGDTTQLLLDKELSTQVEKLAIASGTTLYMTLLAAYHLLLAKYTGSEDIIVGSPIVGRPHHDLENIMGMFVNMLAMRNKPAKEKTFKEFLAEVKENALNAFENQDYQFEELVDKLGIPRDLSRHPLFDTVFVLQNIEIGPIEATGLKFIPYEFAAHIAKFDLLMMAVETPAGIAVTIEYRTAIFKPSTIENMLKRYREILAQVTENPEIKLGAIKLSLELLLAEVNVPAETADDFAF